MLLAIGPQQHLLSITLAHIIADGWSAGVLWRELAVLYAARSRGETVPLADLPIAYVDYAAWQVEQYSRMAEELLEFWRQKLAGLPTLDLPTDRPRPLVQTFAGGRWSVVLDRATCDSLKALGAREGCTLFMTMLAVFKVLLARYSGQEDIVVGTPVANRDRVETESMIGLFVNSLVLRTDLSGDPSFRECLRRVRDEAVAAFDYQAMPFEQLVVEMRPERDVSRNPLFQVMFNFVGGTAQWTDLEGVAVEEVELANPTSKFDLTLAIQEVPEGLKADFEFNTDLFDQATISRMAEQLGELVGAVLEDPDGCVWHRQILTAEERRLFLSPPEPAPSV